VYGLIEALSTEAAEADQVLRRFRPTPSSNMQQETDAPMPSGESSSSELDGIRHCGEREYFQHRGEYRNPFEMGSDAYNAYERGWMKSLKLNGGKLGSAATPAPAVLPRRLPSTSEYNAYAEMKGRSKPRT
jgi:hypothetical protein